jgi:predicted RecB family nuclease
MINDEIIESYLNCKYKAYRKLNNEQGIIKEFEILQEEQLSMRKQEFYNRLLEKYGKKQLSKGYKFKNSSITLRAKALIQPILDTDTYQLSFDAIEIVTNKKSPSRKLYIPLLVTSKERVSKKEKLSIVIKCVILSKICGIDYEFGRVIYGSELKTLKFKVEPLLTEARKALTELHKMSKSKSQPIIFHKNHCKICEFQEICKKELAETDGLGLLHRMGEKDIKRYNNKGIFTVNQLSYTFRPRRRGKRVKTKQHLYYHSLQALAIREQKVYLYDKTDMPNAKTKIYIDMEGNTDGSFIYLIGILIVRDNKEKRHSLWADNPSDEEKIFAELIAILTEYNNGYVFYFGKYESRVFKRLLKSNSSIEIENLIRNKSINILDLIYSNIYFPTYSNGLKDIGIFLGCSWSSPNPSGIQSIIWRDRWKHTKEPRIKEALIEYNYEDCIALKTVVDFIYEVFDRCDSEQFNNKLQNTIGFVEEIRADDGPILPLFRDFKAVSKDIEIISKCAYFEYQRNKIYFRKNKRIRKKIKCDKKQVNIRYKPNKIIEIKAYRCPYCRSENIVKKENKIYNKVCIDLRFLKYGIKRWITKYQTYPYKCLSCKKSSIPKFTEVYIYNVYKHPQKYHMNYERIGFGSNLLLWIMIQNVVNGLPLNSLQKILREYFEISIEYHQIWYLKFLASEWYRETYRAILQKIINGHLIHADETQVKIKVDGGYIWVFTNIEEVIYLYRPTRETDFLHELLKGFEGILITDFYSGYDSLNCIQQKCLVHLIRDLNDDLLKNPFDDELKELVTSFGRLVINIINTIDRYGLSSRYLKRHKKEVLRFYNWLLNESFNSEYAEKFKKRLIKYEKKLFVFLDYDNVPWNNNNAEHAIKAFADFRSHFKGQTSEKGLEIHLILLSIYQTCNYKGISFLDFLLSKERDIDKFMQKH